jgi:non-canonical purine NTP pyrophosphatase (RdgB/HAM1 family)
MTVAIVTSNHRKLDEARSACSSYGVKLEHIQIDIDEIQHTNATQIALHKAKQAFRLLEKPLIINDSSWDIPALNGFPGGYMKDVAQWLSAEDFITLVQNKEKRICCIETVIYISESEIKIFQKEYWGVIVSKPRGSGTSIEQVTEVNGKTLAEYRNQGISAVPSEDYIWHDFAEWYSNKTKISEK